MAEDEEEDDDLLYPDERFGYDDSDYPVCSIDLPSHNGYCNIENSLNIYKKWINDQMMQEISPQTLDFLIGEGEAIDRLIKDPDEVPTGVPDEPGPTMPTGPGGGCVYCDTGPTGPPTQPDEPSACACPSCEDLKDMGDGNGGGFDEDEKAECCGPKGDDSHAKCGENDNKYWSYQWYPPPKVAKGFENPFPNGFLLDPEEDSTFPFGGWVAYPNPDDSSGKDFVCIKLPSTPQSIDRCEWDVHVCNETPIVSESAFINDGNSGSTSSSAECCMCEQDPNGCHECTECKQFFSGNVCVEETNGLETYDSGTHYSPGAEVWAQENTNYYTAIAFPKRKDITGLTGRYSKYVCRAQCFNCHPSVGYASVRYETDSSGRPDYNSPKTKRSVWEYMGSCEGGTKSGCGCGMSEVCFKGVDDEKRPTTKRKIRVNGSDYPGRNTQGPVQWTE